MTVWCIVVACCGTSLAQDDGARAYWKTMEDTNVLSFQYLQLNADTYAELYDPSLGIYPNAETDLDLYLLSYARQIALFGRSSTVSASIYGGDINSQFAGDPLDPNSVAFRQTVNGFGDPGLGLTVNLYGAPAIANFADVADYEPSVTVDVAGLLTVPVGEYDEDRAVNIGQNRWWGRLALPVVFYFGSYAPLYRSSIEVTPSVYIFGENDDYLGQTLENDPLFQLEAHYTRDITRSLFGSIDYVWRHGFDSEINGADVGDELEMMALGFTFDYTLNDNSGIRLSYHSNFIDDDDLDADMLRLQFYYGWNALVENTKALGHH
jgi:hypothetical protein